MGKSKSKVTIVGPKTVRAWFHEAPERANITVTKTVKGETVEQPANTAALFAGPQGKGRGRLAANGPLVQAFLAAHPGTAYAEKVESVPTVAVPLFDKRGRKTGRKADIPLSDFRSLSGQALGRPSQASLVKAGEAVSAQRRK